MLKAEVPAPTRMEIIPPPPAKNMYASAQGCCFMLKDCHIWT